MSRGEKPAPRAPRLSLRQVIWMCLGAVSVVFVVSTTFSVLGRVDVARAVDQLDDHMLPAKAQVAELGEAYVDQETGQRGFLLTADPAFLEPYYAGKAWADRLVTDLGAALAGDDEAARRLNAVVTAARAWLIQAAEPQIAARRAASIPPDQLGAMTLSGKQLFDQLRVRLSDLEARTGELIARQLDEVRDAQRLANIAQAAAALLLVLVLATTVWLLHRVLTRPVRSILDDVSAVAEGDYDRVIHSAGLREVALLAQASETMRDSLRTSTKRLLDAERRDEQARIAVDLRDRTIARVFGLGLKLTSAAQRRSPDLRPLIDETDGIIADLRGIVFNLNSAATDLDDDASGLCEAIFDVVEDCVSALGFTPDLHFEGPIAQNAGQRVVRTEVLTVLGEWLIIIAAHAHASAATIELTATGDELRLTLRANGIDLNSVAPARDARRKMHHRAEQLGGHVTMRAAGDDGGTIVEWAVPVATMSP